MIWQLRHVGRAQCEYGFAKLLEALWNRIVATSTAVAKTLVANLTSEADEQNNWQRDNRGSGFNLVIVRCDVHILDPSDAMQKRSQLTRIVIISHQV